MDVSDVAGESLMAEKAFSVFFVGMLFWIGTKFMIGIDRLANSQQEYRKGERRRAGHQTGYRMERRRHGRRMVRWSG
jgi:hypothetical protein